MMNYLENLCPKCFRRCQVATRVIEHCTYFPESIETANHIHSAFDAEGKNKPS